MLLYYDIIFLFCACCDMLKSHSTYFVVEIKSYRAYVICCECPTYK